MKANAVLSSSVIYLRIYLKVPAARQNWPSAPDICEPRPIMYSYQLNTVPLKMEATEHARKAPTLKPLDSSVSSILAVSHLNPERRGNLVCSYYSKERPAFN